MVKLKYVNLGCGSHFHQDWINIDFVSTGDGVVAHNLTQGIPLESKSAEVVYHSHVLEHFSKSQAVAFIQECYRVLKPNGIIRIAIPDLLGIINEYNNITQKLDKDPDDLQTWANYDWIMLEMYDQMVRNTSGGEMAKYLFQDEIINLDFVYQRIGYEGKSIRENFLLNKQRNKGNLIPSQEDLGIKVSFLDKLIFVLQNPKSFFRNKLRHWLFKEEIKQFEENKHFASIGKFRLSGEIHQWMYDKYSLARLLKKCGFENIKIQTHIKSSIPDWATFGIETINGKIRKPDSLFIEATKPL